MHGSGKQDFPYFYIYLYLSVLLLIYQSVEIQYKCSLYQYVFVPGIFLALQLDIRSPFELILMSDHFHLSAFCSNAARNNTFNDSLMCVMKDLGDWEEMLIL